MSLSSIANPAWETIRGVRFAMQFGPSLVAVLVTTGALENMEPSTSGVAGHLACFSKHRDLFERVASAKHQRGDFDESGVVIVETSDLKAISHS